MDVDIERRIHELLAGKVSREDGTPCRIELTGVSVCEWSVERIVVVMNTEAEDAS